MSVIATVGTVAAALGGSGVVGYFTVRLTNRTENRKVDLAAETVKNDGAEQVQGMALQLLEPIQARLASAEGEVDTLRSKVSDLIEQVENANRRAREAEERARVAELERDAYKAQAEARYPLTDPAVNQPTQGDTHAV